jgi:hypothetical protein
MSLVRKSIEINNNFDLGVPPLKLKFGQDFDFSYIYCPLNVSIRNFKILKSLSEQVNLQDRNLVF